MDEMRVWIYKSVNVMKSNDSNILLPIVITCFYCPIYQYYNVPCGGWWVIYFQWFISSSHGYVGHTHYSLPMAKESKSIWQGEQQ